MGSDLIVDGYNIINSWTSLKSLANEDMEQARGKLIEILASYKAYKGIEIILVFDAQLVKGSLGNEEIINGIKVVFTREHQTADSYIEKEVYNLSRLNHVQVATSDWAEQQTILSSGGTRISARELESEVIFAKSRMRKKYIDKKRTNNGLFHQVEPGILRKLERLRKKQD